MNLGAVFLTIVVLVLVTLFVAQPFTSHWRMKTQSSHQVSSLLAERERALNALIELDFDNGIGKVPAEEYSIQRTSLIQRGSEILRQLDELQAAEALRSNRSVKPNAAIQTAKPLSDEELEDMVAKRRSAQNHKTAGFCPNCGKPIYKSDIFCPSCGQAVNSK
jgi:hypothetical protein